jgi:hypothetical protein
LGIAPFAESIKNVMTVEVDYFRLGNFSACSQSGRVGNFATVPEPAAILLGTIGLVLGRLRFLARRKISAAR